MQELKTCKKCSSYVWIEKGFQECDYCLGSRNQSRKDQKETAQTERNKLMKIRKKMAGYKKHINILMIMMLILLAGCKPLTTASPEFRAIQQDLIETNNTLKALSRQTKMVADKVGLEVRDLSPETEKRIQLMEKAVQEQAQSFASIMSVLKPIAEAAGKSVGIPAPATSAGFDSVQSLLIGFSSLLAGKTVSDTLSARRRRKEDEEWEQYCKELEAKKEKEKEDLKLLLKG